MLKKINYILNKNKKYISGSSFIVPALIFIFIFVIFPAILSILLSFFKWKGYGSFVFVGFGNYIKMFTIDTNFKTALKNSLLYSIFVSFGTILIGLFFAIVIDLKKRFYKIYRFIFFLSVILPVAATGLLFSNLLDPYGLINVILVKLGIANMQNFPWMGDTRTAFFVIVLIEIWQFSGFPMIFFLAGMQNIDETIYESALIDGASTITRIFKITIPLLKNVFSIIIILQIIFTFKVFDRIWIMTGGGPVGSTEVLGTQLYQDAFRLGAFGYASVLATIMFIVAFIFSIIYTKISGYGKKFE